MEDPRHAPLNMQRGVDEYLQNGLSPDDAAARLAAHGRNELRRAKRVSPFVIFIYQFQSAVVALLAGAAAVSLALGEFKDSLVIAAIILLNAAVGFIQEYRAERAVLALRSMTAPRARVRRGGISQIIPAAEVVTDDLLILDEGAESRPMPKSSRRTRSKSMKLPSPARACRCARLRIFPPPARRSRSAVIMYS